MQDDLKLLQGAWNITSLEVEGQESPDSMLTDAGVVIKGNRFTTTGMGAVYEGRLKLDPSRRPPQIDMKFEAGPEKGNTNPGIYKLDGDTWKLCLATRGSVRPSKFASTPGSGFALETLSRAKRGAAKKVQPEAAAKTSSRSAPVTEFEGEWKMVSGVMNGIAMEESAVQWVKRVTIGDEISVIAGPQVLMKMTFKHDPSQAPKAIDYVNTAGSNKGKTQLGIYEFDGGLLQICMAAPGSPRPSKFESVRGDGRSFTVWKKSI